MVPRNRTTRYRLGLGLRLGVALDFHLYLDPHYVHRKGAHLVYDIARNNVQS